VVDEEVDKWYTESPLRENREDKEKNKKVVDKPRMM
jgi:hypothetical protein